MRTLQEKYNAIQEGKFSKENFLRDARLQLPNLVTQYNGYDDAVQILKNRGMIQEAKKETVKEWSPYGSMAFSGERKQEKEKAPLSSLEVGDLIYIQGVSGDNIIVKDKKGDGTVGVGHPHNDKVSYQDGNKEVQVVKRANLKEARLTKNSLTDYRYKPTNEMDKYPYEQILRGLRVELEGLGVTATPTPEEYRKALAKVLKNLEKDEIFYTNQIAGIKANAKRTDLMVDATPKNEVDKENGLQKAQLKESFKKLIKNILSENTEEEVYEMQGPKEDSYYKSELSDYLDDNGIFGYTDRIHSIMTGPDEAENANDLVRFLEDNQIYGYGRGIERIYADYPYDQHWMNQEDEADDISHPRGYEEASDEESFDDLFESVSLKDLL